MSDTDKPDCTNCHGRGQVSELVTETDSGMSIAMGSALGMGYFPMTRTVTKDKTCPVCGGSGKQR